MKKKLNLGCGDKLLPDYTNVDLYNPKADMAVDLFNVPWPWDTSSVDEVVMEHFFEHCPDVFATIKEVHRILKPNGTWHVIVPHARSIHAHALGHCQLLTYCSFEQMCNPFEWWGATHSQLFKMEMYRATLMKSKHIKWTPFDWIASKYPVLWEKFAFSFLTPTELEWKGSAIK